MLDLIARIMRFGIVGVAITAINYLLYAYLVAHRVHYLVATTVGWVLGVCIAFFGNKYLTFLHHETIDGRQVRRFLTCYISQLLIGSATMIILIDGNGVGHHLAFFINVAITSCYSFLFMDRLVFQKPTGGLSS